MTKKEALKIVDDLIEEVEMCCNTTMDNYYVADKLIELKKYIQDD